MSVIIKQLIINHFDLPAEANEIIKEYAFYDVVKRTKQTKNRIMRLINNTFYSPAHILPPLSPKQYVFCMDENSNSPQFQIHFCVKCGNYTFPIPYIASTKIICYCRGI